MKYFFSKCYELRVREYVCELSLCERDSQLVSKGIYIAQLSNCAPDSGNNIKTNIPTF